MNKNWLKLLRNRQDIRTELRYGCSVVSAQLGRPMRSQDSIRILLGNSVMTLEVNETDSGHPVWWTLALAVLLLQYRLIY